MLAKSVKIIGFGFGLLTPALGSERVIAGLFASFSGGWGFAAVAIGLLLFLTGQPSRGGPDWRPFTHIHMQTVS